MPFKSLGFFNLPDFLVNQIKIIRYTYDPDKSLAKQPFYNIKENEIYRQPPFYSPIFEKAHSPTFNRFGVNVDEFGPFKVPKGKYWVMGDSRKNSKDARYWGFLDKDLIHGRASFIIYSVDSEESLWIFELLKHPFDFWTKKIRWNRFFKNIK